jgi:hypothetical protein
MDEQKMTHNGPEPAMTFDMGGSGEHNTTITFPDRSGFLLSEADYRDVQKMLAEWRARG